MRVGLKVLICAAVLVCLLLNAGCIRITFGRIEAPTAAPQETGAPAEEASAAPTQAARGVLNFVNDSDLDVLTLYISVENVHNAAPAAAYIARGDSIRLRFRDLGGLPGGEYYIDVRALTGVYYYLEYGRVLEDGDVLRFYAEEASPSGYAFSITGADGRTDRIPATELRTQGGGTLIGS